MSNFKTIAKATLVGAIAALSSATTSAGATVSTVDIPPGFVVPFPRCPQHETVVIQGGQLQTLFNESVDKDGGLHITYRQQMINVTALGSVTGAEYRMVGNVQFNPSVPFVTINDREPIGTAQIVVHSTVAVQVVPVGGSDADRVSIHLLVHRTYTPEHELTAEIADINATCDG